MSEANGWSDTNNAFSLLAVADPIHRRDRAAPLPAPLSTGMGGRTGTPRGAAGPLGQVELERQTRTAEARPGRVLGCAVAATTKTGGRNVSRLAVWRAAAAGATQLHFDCRRHSGARHWRERGALQPG